MSPLDSEARKAENVRIEYQVIADHHTHLIGTRFTIAGLYLAAMGLLLQQVFSDTNDLIPVLMLCFLGFILTCIIWIMEARTRRLIGICAERMQQIEREEWQMGGRDWYKGYMSRIHQTPPASDYEYSTEVPLKSPHERHKAKIFNFNIRGISHSLAFDILYLLFVITWISLFYFYSSGIVSTSLEDIVTLPNSSIVVDHPLPTQVATYTPAASATP